MFMWKKMIPRCIYLERGRLACDPQKRTLNIYTYMCARYIILYFSLKPKRLSSICMFVSLEVGRCYCACSTRELSTRLDSTYVGTTIR